MSHPRHVSSSHVSSRHALSQQRPPRVQRGPWLGRRNLLRGLGVTLALPWLEALSVPGVQAQAQGRAKRYLFVYFCNGASRAYWPPRGVGQGDAWQLSPLQDSLTDVKQHVSVLSNVSQTELFGTNEVEPSHSNLCAPTLSCTKASQTEAILGGPTVDQVIAQRIGDRTPFESLQYGLSTLNSSPDLLHPAISRSISWAATDQPLYKEVSPQAAFDRLVAQIGPSGEPTPEALAQAELRRARDLSVLDYVLEQATGLHSQLSTSDRTRLDQFMTSVRDLEGRVQLQDPTLGLDVDLPERPFAAGVGQEPVGYNRDTHAEIMNDIIALAFQADQTRVITHMLDDARSDYTYSFLKVRQFSDSGSVETDEPVGSEPIPSLLGFHSLQHAGDDNNGFATCIHWLVSKFGTLVERLASLPEPDGSGTTLLDNTIVTFMCGMQGSNHNADKLPVMIAGRGGGVFKTNWHHSFASELRLADLHYTIIREGFGLSDMAQFGNSGGVVSEILV